MKHNAIVNKSALKCVHNKSVMNMGLDKGNLSLEKLIRIHLKYIQTNIYISNPVYQQRQEVNLI